MDRGPFRAQQRPVEQRRAASGPEPVRVQSEEPELAPASLPPEPMRPAPTPSARHDTSEKPAKSKSSSRFVLPILITLVVIVLAVVGWFVWPKSSQSDGPADIDGNKYQAVFFTNGQVYFGKLHPLNGSYMKLTDIFYLQNQSSSSDTSDNPQKTTGSQTNDVKLIKLGDEIHGPEDEMVISKDQVLFYENLKADGKVAKTIAQYKQSHN